MTTGQIPHARVNLDVIYTELVALRTEVAAQGIPDIRADVTDHETRIRKLEAWIWRATGIAACIGAAGGAIASEMLGGLSVP